MSGTLYLVGTPIGNLSDLSPRAKQILASVDFIAAEDTRVSLKLLNHFDIRRPLVSYHEHNRAQSGEKILTRLLAGESCALVTDAGMPAISDPGEDLVRLCAEHDVIVSPVPGPSACIAALAASALPTQRFCFEGFLSTAKKSRAEHLRELKDEKRTMIFHEAPHKLVRTLADMLAAWGDRDVAVCRELTKLHEQFFRCTLSEALAYYEQNPPKGEFVLVVRGAEEAAAPEMTRAEALELVKRLRGEGMRLKDACREAADAAGLATNELYQAALRESSGD